MSSCSELNSVFEKGKKIKKRKASVISDRTARKVLAPFLRRLKKQGTQKLFSKADNEYQKLFLRSKVKDVVSKLQSFCKDKIEVSALLNETSEFLKEITKSFGVSAYLVDSSNEYLILTPKYLPENDRHRATYKIEPGTTVAAYVAYSLEYVMVDDILGDARFPLGIPGAGKTVKSVLCLPILTDSNKCLAVIELYRNINQNSYEGICIAVTSWMGAAVHQNNERLFVMKKNELNDYLMSLINFYFRDQINFDKFVSDIVECAKLSVHAERGSLYVFDEEISEGVNTDIVADVYEEAVDSTRAYTFKKRNKQRFSKNSTGIPGFIVREGKILNIKDANNDPKVSKTYDYHGSLIKTIIIIPLKGNTGILGMLQLVNKFQEPYFTEKDEILLNNIAEYAYIVCKHECLKKQIRTWFFRYRGQEELLKIQLKPCPDDLRFLRYLPITKKTDMPNGFFNFDWIITGREEEGPNFAVFMFTYLLGDQYFDYYKLTEFALMVKKSYRENPYHNFSHAFTVFHCMFNILHRNIKKFTKFEILALLIATICHDSDHVGYTNNFLEMTNHWLSELYWESPLEHHHYDVCILMLEATELLSNFSESKMDEIKKLIKFLILATDLVQFFRNKNQMLSILKSGSFEWNDTDHRLMFLGIAMTVCDVSGQCKPFYSAKKVTEGLYREFYNQGDIEKKLGFIPLTMMDREKRSTIPENQIQFLSLVCIPCVEILVAVFPNTEELLRQCVELKDCWSVIEEKKIIDVWKMDDCVINKKNKKNSGKRVVLL